MIVGADIVIVALEVRQAPLEHEVVDVGSIGRLVWKGIPELDTADRS